MRLSVTTLALPVFVFVGCYEPGGKDVRLSDLRLQEIGGTVTTVGGITPPANPRMTIEFPLPGSVPGGTSDADCAHLSQNVEVLINGSPAGGYRGGRTDSTWSGCSPTGNVFADVDAGTVDVLFRDGADTATMQVEFELPTLTSPLDGVVRSGSEVVVRLPSLPGVSPSTRYTARLYAPGDGPAYDIESSRPNGCPNPIDLEVVRNGDVLSVRMPSNERGTWLMHISHPDHLDKYEIPVTRCEFEKCSARLWDFYAVFPAIQVELVD